MDTEYSGTACGTVVNHILNRIASGELNEGDKLDPERNLSAHLNVSRATVREAIKVLNYLGFVDSTQGAGNYITNSCFNTVARIMHVMYQRRNFNMEDFTNFRQMLEMQAFDHAISRATDAQKRELLQITSLLHVCSDDALLLSLDKRFHTLLVESSCNELLLLNYRALSLVTEQYLHDTLFYNVRSKDPKFETMAQLHTKIAEALISGDVEQGHKAISSHFHFAMH